MNRRSFFKTSATAMAAVRASVLACADGTPEINTVLWPIPAGSLDRVLMHEHVMEDFVGADRIAPGRYDAEEVLCLALPHVKNVRALAPVAYFRVAVRLIPPGTTSAHIPFQIKARGIAILLNSGIGQDLCSWAFRPGIDVCFIWPKILRVGGLAFQKVRARLLAIQVQPEQFIGRRFFELDPRLAVICNRVRNHSRRERSGGKATGHGPIGKRARHRTQFQLRVLLNGEHHRDDAPPEHQVDLRLSW